MSPKAATERQWPGTSNGSQPAVVEGVVVPGAPEVVVGDRGAPCPPELDHGAATLPVRCAVIWPPSTPVTVQPPSGAGVSVRSNAPSAASSRVIARVPAGSLSSRAPSRCTTPGPRRRWGSAPVRTIAASPCPSNVEPSMASKATDSRAAATPDTPTATGVSRW